MGKDNGCLVVDKLKSYLGLKISCLERVCMGWVKVYVGIMEEIDDSSELTSLMSCEELNSIFIAIGPNEIVQYYVKLKRIQS